jgi:GDP-4-dehydro-6-deoxy-D-mannose reductase
MNIVVTGINGFVGKHLARELFGNGVSVFGVGREDSLEPSISKYVERYVTADISQTWPEIDNVDAIINLAGLAAVGASFDNPQLYININSAILTNICEYYLKSNSKPRIVSVTSGAIYSHQQQLPITENSAFDYSSPYSISKILNENQLIYYRKRGLDCVSARPFNHIGPGQMPGFLVPDLIEKINLNPTEILAGNLKTKRDYTDVRDVARAYYLLATTTALSSNRYNICSGESVSGEEILEVIAKSKDIKTPKIIVDESKIRPNEVMDIYGDHSLLSKDTGWQPQSSLTQTIRDIINS